MTEVLAIDIGGTKLAAARVSDQGRIIEQRSRPTAGVDAEGLFDSLCSLVSPFVDSAPLAGCGVGCGGPMTADGELVSPLNIPQWSGFPLRERLGARFGLSVVVDNDAKAFALAERRFGAAADVSNFIAMVVSTGVGGGIVLDGRLLHGRLGNAGHIGHVVVDPDGPRCKCGGRGCLEAMASGTALRRDLGYAPELAPREVRRRTGRLVGRAVAAVSKLLDLHLAVVGGSVALGFGSPFFDAAQSELDAQTGLEFSNCSKLVPAGLGADGPLIGAAEIWRDHSLVGD